MTAPGRIAPASPPPDEPRHEARPAARPAGAAAAAPGPSGAAEPGALPFDRDEAAAGSLRDTLQGFVGLLRALHAVSGRRVWIGLGFLVLSTLSEGASILLLLPILHLADRGEGGYAVDLAGRSLFGIELPEVRVGLGLLLAGLVGLVVLQAWFNRRKAVYFSDLLQTFSNHTRAELFRAVAHARWDRLVRMRMGNIEYALTGEIERLNQSLFATLNVVQSVVGLLLFLGLSLVISVPMTVFAFGFGLAALAALHPFRRMSAQFGERLMRRRTDQFSIVSQFLGGLKTARSMNEEPRHIALFDENLARTRAEANAYSRRNALGSGLFQIALAAGAALFVLLALRVEGLALPQMIVLLLVLMRVAPRFMALQGQFNMLLVNQSAFRRLRDLAAQLARDREDAGAGAGQPVAVPRREILLDDVTYHHPPQEVSGGGGAEAALPPGEAEGARPATGSGRDAGEAPPVAGPGAQAPPSPPGLTGCTIRIPVGRVTAVIGASGSGKSTVADIVTGLIRPQSGALRIDGAALGPAQLRAWRDLIAYVPQETFLLNDTIRANLRTAAPDADDAALLEALEAAAADFVADLPRGLDSLVGDRGAMLSGGERQRIALARAFLRRPALLVLDEATSALDWRSQARVARSLARMAGEMTILTIAHRPSMVLFSDRVHALAGGRLVEAGATADLLRRPDSLLSQMLAHEGLASPAGRGEAEPDGAATAGEAGGADAVPSGLEARGEGGARPVGEAGGADVVPSGLEGRGEEGVRPAGEAGGADAVPSGLEGRGEGGVRPAGEGRGGGDGAGPGGKRVDGGPRAAGGTGGTGGAGAGGRS